MTSQKLAKRLLSHHEQISFQKVRLPVLLICKSVLSLRWANGGHFVKSKAKAPLLQQCSRLLSKCLPNTSPPAQLGSGLWRSIQKTKGAGDGSRVKSTDCSSRKPGLDSQHPHGDSQPSRTLVPRNLMLTSASMCTKYIHTYIHVHST